MSLINTINSITSVNLDTFSPEPSIDGKGSHGGYCGPAVKPIALNMVAEIARDPETRGLPISGIGGVTTWRDAAEFMALGAGNVQVCTAAMTYGFKIVQEMITGLSQTGWTRRATAPRRDHRPRGAECHRLAVPEPELRHQGAHRPGRCASSAAAATSPARTPSHQAITQIGRRQRHFEVIEDECVGCNLCVNVCPVEDCIAMVPLKPGDDRRSAPASRS